MENTWNLKMICEWVPFKRSCQGSHRNWKSWNMKIVMKGHEHEQLAKTHRIFYHSWSSTNFAAGFYQICTVFANILV